ncbi:MAG: DUF424 domain-containing protein [Candidatus Freyarchaeota archaeon]|mgnify:CR=1 FL=1|nr:DUF424 family protein [Candidatus Freyrarchaeum guaymaensis]
MKVYLSERRIGDDVIIAICDEEILGKTFREGDLKLEVKKDFYGGRLVPVEDGLKAIERGTIVNLVGNVIISKAVEAGLIPAEGVIKIQGVAHAQKIIL